MSIIINGKSGLNSSQEKMNSISNNISNINTNGYKSIDNSFEDVFHSKLNSIGLPTNSLDNHIEEGSGSRADNIIRNFSQGSIIETGRDLDIAVNGNGFFKLKNNDGSYSYTRDGNFNIDKEGNIAHSSGLVLDLTKNIALNSNDKLSIHSDGQVFVNDENISKIELYSFKNMDGFISKGENLFSTNEEPKKINSEVRQGCIEKSNVDLTTQITNMIENQRIFSLNSKSLKTGDEMWQIANNLRNR